MSSNDLYRLIKGYEKTVERTMVEVGLWDTNDDVANKLLRILVNSEFPCFLNDAKVFH